MIKKYLPLLLFLLLPSSPLVAKKSAKSKSTNQEVRISAFKYKLMQGSIAVLSILTCSFGGRVFYVEKKAWDKEVKIIRSRERHEKTRWLCDEENKDASETVNAWKAIEEEYDNLIKKYAKVKENSDKTLKQQMNKDMENIKKKKNKFLDNFTIPQKEEKQKEEEEEEEEEDVLP